MADVRCPTSNLNNRNLTELVLDPLIPWWEVNGNIKMKMDREVEMVCRQVPPVSFRDEVSTFSLRERNPSLLPKFTVKQIHVFIFGFLMQGCCCSSNRAPQCLQTRNYGDISPVVEAVIDDKISTTILGWIVPVNKQLTTPFIHAGNNEYERV